MASIKVKRSMKLLLKVMEVRIRLNEAGKSHHDNAITT